MMRKKHLFSVVFSVVFVFCISVFSYSEKKGWGEPPGDDTAEDKSPFEMIGEAVSKISPKDAYVVGIGSSTQENKGKAKILAREKAFLEGYAKCVELIKGVYIKGEELQQIQESETYKQSIEVTVQGYCKGAQEVTGVWSPGQRVYFVVLSIPDFENSVRKKYKLDIRWVDKENAEPVAKATGMGACESKCEGLDLVKARELAYNSARQKLYIATEGALIKMYSKTEADKEDIKLKIRSISTKFEGILKNAQAIGESYDDKDNTYSVELAIYKEVLKDAIAVLGFPEK